MTGIFIMKIPLLVICPLKYPNGISTSVLIYLYTKTAKGCIENVCANLQAQFIKAWCQNQNFDEISFLMTSKQMHTSMSTYKYILLMYGITIGSCKKFIFVNLQVQLIDALSSVLYELIIKYHIAKNNTFC